MAFLDKLSERAKELAQTGVAKSKQMAQITKLKADNMAEEDAIKKAYIEIGKLYYAERGAAPDGAYVASCEKITRSKAIIEDNNKKIEELKAQDADYGTGAASDFSYTESTSDFSDTMHDMADKASDTAKEAFDRAKDVAHDVSDRIGDAMDDLTNSGAPQETDGTDSTESTDSTAQDTEDPNKPQI